MCWSADADLIAGGAVAAVGVACLVQLRRVPDLPLAALPLLLGAHQVIESLVWRDPSGAAAARTAWAVIALPLLPVLVPLGVLLAARPPARRRVVPLLAVGAATAAALCAGLAAEPVTAHVRGHALGYGIGLPAAPLLIAGYLVATVGSLLAGGDRVLRLLGVVVAIGAAVCVALWRLEFVSTWCAFAAVVSVVLLWWVRGRAGPNGGGRPGGGRARRLRTRSPGQRGTARMIREDLKDEVPAPA